MIALLVGVLHALADLHEQLEPLARRQPVPVAVLGDRHALDVLHRRSTAGRARWRPASKTLAMPGWSISASAWRSASKRATTCVGVHARA